MSGCNIHVQRYIDMVLNNEIVSCEDQIALCKHIKNCFQTEEIYTDDVQLEDYLHLAEYFPFEKLFEWEEFITALHLCTYWKNTGMPRWPDLFCLIGRGAGKDGFIAFESVCLVSPYNGIRSYDVDICANNEDQAMRPINDIVEAFEQPKWYRKLKRFFYWTKEIIKCKSTNSYIKGHTNSPKGKDGLRSGVVIFNEIHQYQNTANINVFTTGLGKKKHPRRSLFTTNGDVREGVLDDYIEKSEKILFNGASDKGMLPFICRLDSKDEVHDKNNWPKANPSLPYLPNLMLEIEKEYEDWLESPASLSAFMTKRMNRPDTETEKAVADYENIKATNKPLPELRGMSCICGIDLSKTSDWTAVNLHFRDGDKRYDICHAWVCKRNQNFNRLNCPWKVWEEQGLLSVVDDVEIDPNMIADYIKKMKSIYKIKKVCIDSFRYTIMASALRSIGFDSKEKKNVKLIKPSDIMKVYPVIDRCFIRGYFYWDDNPMLRWATNNTKLIRAVTRANNTEPDVGNYLFGKIEPMTRKTDPFIALVASMVEEECLPLKSTKVPEDINIKFYSY